MGLVETVGKQMLYPKGWLGKMVFPVMERSTIGLARWTAELMAVQPDDHVVEVGFGSGANLALLASKATGGRVIGVEVAEAAMEMASRKNADLIDEGRVELHRVEVGESGVRRNRVHRHPHRAQRRRPFRCALHARPQAHRRRLKRRPMGRGLRPGSGRR